MVLSEFYSSYNYSNSLAQKTKIKYTIPSSVETRHASSLQLKVYDVLGNEVSTLVNVTKQLREYEIEFSAKGGSAYGGNAKNLPSGVYSYHLKAGELIKTKKMVLMK